ncbi:MAG: S8 family serine peptidase [Verrucomicrobiota bacterium]|nr:S8 family serine peptidase [Verrucomicrobiota bacterium]
MKKPLLLLTFAAALAVVFQTQAQNVPMPEDGAGTNDPPTPAEIEAAWQTHLAILATNRTRFAPWLAKPMTLPNGQPANQASVDALTRTNLLLLAEAFSISRQETLQAATNSGTPTELIFPNGERAILSSFVDGHPVWNMDDSLTQAVSIATAAVWPGGAAGFNLTGSNTPVGMWETGTPRLTHNEFQGRVVQRDGASEMSSHATAVASVLGAGGVYNLVIGGVTNVQAAKGMSYAAPVWANDTIDDMAEMAEEAATNGLRISNHSYSARCGWLASGTNWFWFGDTNVSQTVDWKFGAYTPEAYSIDTNVFISRTYLPVWTPGNSRNEGPPAQPTNHFYVLPGTNVGYWITGVTRSIDGDAGGYDAIHPQGNAKNTLTVGAVNNLPGGYIGATNVIMSSFSPFGPTDDGRIKPDVVAPGVNIPMATTNSNTAFQSASARVLPPRPSPDRSTCLIS